MNNTGIVIFILFGWLIWVICFYKPKKTITKPIPKQVKRRMRRPYIPPSESNCVEESGFIFLSDEFHDFFGGSK